jgi:cellulose synthase/poly-beta-1,6-N-acetylglucosamine synthase-like glycosyltransferase
MLLDRRRVIIVVPAYNEDERISLALIGVPPMVDLALVVDDGSTDRTAEVACEHGTSSSAYHGTPISIPLCGPASTLHFVTDTTSS